MLMADSQRSTAGGLKLRGIRKLTELSGVQNIVQNILFCSSVVVFHVHVFAC